LNRERHRCDDGLERNDRGLMAAGITTTAARGGAAGLGSIFWALALSLGSSFGRDPADAEIGGSIALGAGGLVSLGMGVFMLTRGAQEVPRRDGESSRSADVTKGIGVSGHF
jgi:hypothetical protein